MTAVSAAAPRPDLHAALAALAQLLGGRLSVASAVREQHGNTTTWVTNQPPDAVAFPISEAEVQAIVRICATHGLPIIPFGTGTFRFRRLRAHRRFFPRLTLRFSLRLLASAVIIIVYIALGWAVAFRNRSAAVTISMVSAMRFTPIGLVVISTVLHNQGVYMTPALMFALVDTIIPFVVGAELGKYLTRGEHTPAPAVAPAPAGASTAAATPGQAT